MTTFLAQVVVPDEGLDSALYLPLYVLLLLYLVMFLLGRFFEGREDARADSVEDAGFALLLLSGVYVLILLAMAVAQQFDLVADMVEIIAIMVGFFALLVTVLLGVEKLVALAGRGRRRGAEVPPPEKTD